MDDERPESGQSLFEGQGVIDPAAWLTRRVDVLISEHRYGEAVGYVKKLTADAAGTDQEGPWSAYLGYLLLLADDFEEADRWLRRASCFDPNNPHISYALGYVALTQGDAARGVLCFLEAFVEAANGFDEAEYLRSAAVALMRRMGPVQPVQAMLLGALDRDRGNPWILDALANVYEADQQWMEGLQTLSELADVVRDAARSVVLHRAPRTRQLLRNRLMGAPAELEELRRRSQALNEAVRAQFEVVLEAHHRRGPTGLMPLRTPLELSRLLGLLEWRERAVELVEVAQGLWAQARGEGFDEILGASRLAAAIHLLVERVCWREPTPLGEVARFHGASAEAIPAAARVVAGRLGLELFDAGALKASLTLQEQRRLDQVVRALLFGEGLQDVRAGQIRLG